MSLANEILEFLELIALRSKYTANNPKNKPRGSDLNQPIWPLSITGTETE